MGACTSPATVGRRTGPVLRVSALSCVLRHISHMLHGLDMLTRKHQGVTDVRSRRCQHSGCMHQPSYGWEGDKAQFCA